ncbi:MAG: hypothetical protein AB7N80_07060 [Bdellovibrionales bacterium]
MEDKKSQFEMINDNSALDLNSTFSAQLQSMTPADWREQAVSDYLNCVLCGNEFKFVHATDFGSLVVEEEAHCPHCQIRGNKNSYILQ